MSEPPGPPPRVTWDPGWYPDPLHRYAHRYFNGATWTADVAESGTRYVDPFGTATVPGGAPRGHPAAPPAGRPGRATAAMVLAIVGAVVGWFPVLFVAGFVCAGLAVGFGLSAYRATRANGAAGRSFAIAGLAVAPVAVVASIVGLILTVMLFARVERYLEPGRHEAEITRCNADSGGLTTVEGTIQNLDDGARSYVVRVRILRSGTDNTLARHNIEITGVAAGTTADWSATVPAGASSVSCTITEVTGPFPFGIDPQR